MFPPHEEFAQFPSNTTNQENLSIPSQSTSESKRTKKNLQTKKEFFSLGKNTTSISSNDDDSEVANSFPTNDSINKRSPFPILQVPSLFQLNVRIYYLFMSLITFFLNFNWNSFPMNIKLCLRVTTTTSDFPHD